MKKLILILIYLVIKEAEHLSLSLSVLSLLSIALLIFFLLIFSSLYIVDINPFPVIICCKYFLLICHLSFTFVFSVQAVQKKITCSSLKIFSC